MSNSIGAHSKGEQRSSSAAHQQDVRVCLWLSVSAGGGVGWGCHGSITPPSGSASLLQWHPGHLHVSISTSVIRDLSSILAFHKPILNLYPLFLSHWQLATDRNITNTDAFGLGLRFW